VGHDRQPLDALVAQDVEDADVGQRGDDELPEPAHGLVDRPAGEVGDLRGAREDPEAVAVDAEPHPRARAEHGERRTDDHDEQPHRVRVRPPVVVPLPAQRARDDRDGGGDRRLSRRAEQRRDERPDHDGRGDDPAGAPVDVQRRQADDDRQPRDERPRVDAGGCQVPVADGLGASMRPPA
jgi:hypothetical protein